MLVVKSLKSIIIIKRFKTTIPGPIPLIEIYMRSKTVQDMSLFPKPPVPQRSLNVRHGNVPYFPL